MKTKPLSQSEYPTPYVTAQDLIARAVEKEWYIHNKTPNLKDKVSKGRFVLLCFFLNLFKIMVTMLNNILYNIRQKWRSYFWKKNWYKKWILNRLRFFMGQSILTEGGWLNSKDLWK
jgi:hypothetical protein